MLTLRTRGNAHPWLPADRISRNRSGERRKRAVQAMMAGGLEGAEAYEAAVSAELFAAIDRARPRRRGDR